MSSLLRVLTYHRISDAGRFSPITNISATPAAFAEQMRCLRENYAPVGMDHVLDVMRKGHQLPDRAVLVTFDDAYRDFAEIAWPILKLNRVPVTLFVPTAYPGTQRVFWWDRLKAALMTSEAPELVISGRTFRLSSMDERHRAYADILHILERRPHAETLELVDRICHQSFGHMPAQNDVLSWPELRTLAREGVTLGAHSRTHPLMTNISPDHAREEVRGSRDDLQREIGIAPTSFAYPGGKYNDVVVRILHDEQFAAAFTTMDGHNDLHLTPPLLFRRTNISPRISITVFRLLLLSSFPRVKAVFRKYASPAA